ncbi:MAG: hypothetical protein OEY89_08510 [Gammaproteobacteria bacterium]|nr:hypothetical protein [Gammaproteobacteria bacterium]
MSGGTGMNGMSDESDTPISEPVVDSTPANEEIVTDVSEPTTSSGDDTSSTETMDDAATETSNETQDETIITEQVGDTLAVATFETENKADVDIAANMSVDDKGQLRAYLDNEFDPDSDGSRFNGDVGRQDYSYDSGSSVNSNYSNNTENILHTHKAMWKALDMMQQQIDESNKMETADTVVVTVAKGAGWTFSAGFVTWALRAGSLAATAFSSLPLWRWVDPLPVLNMSERERKEREDSRRRSERLEDKQDRKIGSVLDDDNDTRSKKTKSKDKKSKAA